MAQYLIEFDGLKYIVMASNIQSAQTTFVRTLEAEGIISIFKIETDKNDEKFVMVNGEKHKVPSKRLTKEQLDDKPIWGYVDITDDELEDGTVLLQEEKSILTKPKYNKKITITQLLSKQDTGYAHLVPQKEKNKNDGDDDDQ